MEIEKSLVRHDIGERGSGWMRIPPCAFAARRWDWGWEETWSRAVAGKRRDPSTKTSTCLRMQSSDGVESRVEDVGEEVGGRSREQWSTCRATSFCN